VFELVLQLEKGGEKDVTCSGWGGSIIIDFGYKLHMGQHIDVINFKGKC